MKRGQKFTSIPSDVNPDFLMDKKKIKKLFKMNHVAMPSFIEQLLNKLKSKKKRKSVFEFAKEYLKGKTVVQIKKQISTAKWLKKKPRTTISVRTVTKR